MLKITRRWVLWGGAAVIGLHLIILAFILANGLLNPKSTGVSAGAKMPYIKSILASGAQLPTIRGSVTDILKTNVIMVEGEYSDGSPGGLVAGLDAETRVYSGAGEQVERLRWYSLEKGMIVEVACRGVIFQTWPPQCTAGEIMIRP